MNYQLFSMFDEGDRQERGNMEAYPQLKVEKWNRRHWAVYDGPELVCVTVYKKGAVEVKRRLEGVLSPGVEIESSPAYVQPALPPPSGHVKWREIERKRYYLPGEMCDTIGKEWFYHPGDRARSDEELLTVLLESRKRGVNLLLDVPPDRHGVIPDEYRDALLRLRKNANL